MLYGGHSILGWVSFHAKTGSILDEKNTSGIKNIPIFQNPGVIIGMKSPLSLNIQVK
jgi:hypothetical protein